MSALQCGEQVANGGLAVVENVGHIAGDVPWPNSAARLVSSFAPRVLAASCALRTAMFSSGLRAG